MSATPLPVDVWDKIVAQLPPPGPKFLPVITFFKTCQQDVSYTIFASLGISREEIKLLQGRYYFSEYEGCWKMFEKRNDEVDQIVSWALMLGWTFPTDRDHTEFLNRGRFFYLIKK